MPEMPELLVILLMTARQTPGVAIVRDCMNPGIVKKNVWKRVGIRGRGVYTGSVHCVGESTVLWGTEQNAR